MSVSEKLNQLSKEQSAPKKWAELDVGVWFQIINVSNPFEGKFGECHIITLRNVETDQVEKTFSISKLPMEKIISDIETHNVFVKSNGLKVAQTSGNSYFDFELVKTSLNFLIKS